MQLKWGLIAAGLLTLATSHLVANEPDSWDHVLPANLTPSSNRIRVPEGLFYEVAASRLEMAIALLNDKSIVLQGVNSSGAGAFGRPDFKCPAKANPYLVRAIYTNGGTGAFYLDRVGSSLLVAHQSLGRSTGEHRSALIVCLDFSPTAIYVQAGGAM
jgi:hypothetical protein